MSGNWPNAVSGRDVVEALRMMEAEFRKNAASGAPYGTSLSKAFTGRALICDGAANEIQALRTKIVSALDCLHHDDAEAARSILSK